ncbi:MAG: hypothetical protein QXO30_01750 [Candidatus Caldarchaeum sp.]
MKDLDAEDLRLVSFVVEFCRCMNETMELTKDWREEIRKKANWKERLLELLVGGCGNISRQYGDDFKEFCNKIINTFEGILDDSRVGQGGIDKVLQLLFDQHVFLEIFSFRNLAKAGLAVIPRLKIQECKGELDSLVILDSSEACVIEVTERRELPNDKCCLLESFCDFMKQHGFKRVGKVLICSEQTNAACRAERLNFDELNDKSRILAAVYRSVSLPSP